MRGFLTGVKRFVLWDYPRACWQYDVMVGLILAFIFLTPTGWFRDQPRTASVIMLQSLETTKVLWIAPALLSQVPEPKRHSVAQDLVRNRFGRNLNVIRLEPILDSDAELDGYLALAKP